jgi:hypothetical protein
VHANFKKHAAKMHGKLKKQNTKVSPEQEPFCADEEQALDQMKRSWNKKNGNS